MPKFFFHHRFGEQRVFDPDGYDFDDAREARNAAVTDARYIIGGRLLEGAPPQLGVVEICDENGRKIDQVSYMDALFA